ncbi:MAG: hypothetical protein KAV99_04105 [Candidatus Latescibacteria bacterium]|nr:hypothetical protein [Candidatus Latescibacterota bacterium]
MDSSADMVERVRSLITPVLEAEQIELVALKLVGFGKGRRLRIFIDKKDGVKLSDCVQVSRKVSELLDTEDLISGKYTLEVSSPGTEAKG